MPSDLLSELEAALGELGLSALAPDAEIGLQCIVDVAGCISNPVCCSNEANVSCTQTLAQDIRLTDRAIQVTQIGLVNLNCVSIL